ncbi:MAG: substrate-binding domain-containing protein [Candidatus Marinimicrobia bacterium]|nr:substrate-binding domain-containing protein [Candidatus Neomarinimicrobiota bacterium]
MNNIKRLENPLLYIIVGILVSLILINLILFFVTNSNINFWISFSSLTIVSLSFVTFIVLYTKYAKKNRIEEYIKNILEDKEALDNDFQAINTSMTELANGNLTYKMSLQSKPIRLNGNDSEQLSQMTELLNSIINHLYEFMDQFNDVTYEHCLRLCYVGADSFKEGQKCAEIMAELINKTGKVAIITGSFNATGLELRRRGFQSYIYNNFKDIKIIGAFEEHESDEIAYQVTREIIQKYPDIKGIYVTEGATPPGVAKAVEESGRTDIKIVGHDLTDETMRYLKKGIISVTIGQGPFAQGHDPVIHLFNHLVGGWKPNTPRLLTNMDIVTKENYRNYWKEGIGIIQTKESLEKLAKPFNIVPKKTLKIAVLGREDSAFWIPVKQGVHHAAKELEKYNTIVDWIIPKEAIEKREVSAKTYGPELQKLMKSYDAIAITNVDKELVPLINKAVKSGIPVATANSEPLSLRSLISTIKDQLEDIINQSNSLSESADASNQAIHQINAAVSQVAKEAQNLNTLLTNTQHSLESLIDDLNKIDSLARESNNVAEETTKSFNMGIKAVENAINNIKDISTSVEKTKEIVNILNSHSTKINDIIMLINSITKQINLLSLNASVEAARAGEAGRGFIVIAEEIRNLALNTDKATKEVVGVVESILDDIKEVYQLTEEDVAKVTELTKLTDTLRETFNDIQNSVDKNKMHVNNIADSIIEMSKLSGEVKDAMKKVAEVSENNAAASEEVFTTIQSLATQIYNTTELANSFKTIAEGQQTMLAKFIV